MKEYHKIPRGRAAAVIMLASAALVAGCASRPVKAPSSPPIVERAPIPPKGWGAGVRLPQGDGKGGFQTANSNISPMEAIWHVRSALNVAALACDDRGVVSNYNALLKRQKSTFSAAYEAEARRFRSTDGSGWRGAMDGHMTRLYNFFAQPFTQREFCAAAARVASEAQSIAAPQFERFSVSAIDRLDQPFQDFYHAYSGYQRDLAAWQARGGRDPVGIGALAGPVAKENPAGAPWRVQLGAFSGWDAARSAWNEVRKRAPGLASFNPHYEEASVKGLVRLQIGPVTHRGDALRLCAAAAVAALDCMPVSPKS